jgi:FKBP-type peptidyl-prolyl cis-trans isomerase
MQVTETHSAGLKREYKVVVGQAELNSELNAKLADMSKRANIKGFRPGKVPVAHLKRVYGRSAMAEVLQDAVDTRSKKLLEEKNLKPAYQPEVKLPTDEAEIAAVMDGKGDLSFTMALEVIPDFDVKDHSGLALVRHVVPVADSEIEETLKRIASQSKNFEEKTGEAKAGDRVTINFVGTIDGTAFDGGTAEDVALEIGSGQFIPGFEDTLRLNGKARITDDAALLAQCTVNGKAPKVGILIEIEEVFMHCAKALKRSKLWEPDYRQDRSQLPSIARIILDQTCQSGVDETEAAQADKDVEGDYKTGLY